MKIMAAKKKSFEQALTRLEEVVAELENGETTLERSVDLYKEGIGLSVLCGESLNAAEKEVTLLRRTADGAFETKPFEGGELE
jgi:exodeoxyribonuclease VII small subunit